MAVRTRSIEYSHEDVALEGELAWDDEWTSPRPGVLVIHDAIKSRAGFERGRAEALATLGSLQILSEDTASALSADYLWLRRAEHALQLEEERQTHTMPRDPVAQRGLARRMGYRDTEGERARQRMLDDWTAARAQVRGHFEALVLGQAP